MSSGTPSNFVQPSSAEELTRRLVFQPGDTFDIGQTFFGLGGLPSLLWQAKNVNRAVTVDVYAPGSMAKLSWSATSEQETEDSVKARADYEARVAKRRKGETYPPPPPVKLETVTARGSVEAVDLLNTHTLALPAYWLPGPTNLLNQRSAIWLSQDAYLELVKTSSTDIYFDISSQAAGELLKSSQTWVDAIQRLRRAEASLGTRREPARARRAQTMTDWPLSINGDRRMVKAWNVKNDFGELVVLANQDNPLILKATVNPAFPGLAQATKGVLDWDALFGYEIQRLIMPHVK